MYNFVGDNANDLWFQAVTALHNEGVVHTGSRDQMTKELMHVSFTLKNPRQRLVFGHDLNPAFLTAEILWILAGFNDVKFLKFWNPKMKSFSDDGIWFHGAYGARIGMEHVTGLDEHRSTLQVPYSYRNQFVECYRTLEANPDSRHAAMTLWIPEYDLPKHNAKPRAKDVPCNVASHLLIRDGKLHWLQFQRSQDAIWGLPTNIWQFTVLQEVMSGWLGLEVGDYSLSVSSFHTYERHWDEVKEIAEKVNYHDEHHTDDSFDVQICADLHKPPHNHDDLRLSRNDWLKVFPKMIELCEKLRKKQEINYNDLVGLPQSWEHVCMLLIAEASRRHKYFDGIEQSIKDLPNFYKKSYQQWFDKIENKKEKK